jgi:hypothetical protein
MKTAEEPAAPHSTFPHAAAMIPLAHVMPDRTVSELLETSQFLLDCDMDTSELVDLEPLSGGERPGTTSAVAYSQDSTTTADGVDVSPHQQQNDDDAVLQRLYNSHDRQREQELLIEQPVYNELDYLSFPPPVPAYSSSLARRTRSQTSMTAAAVAAHDSSSSNYGLLLAAAVAAPAVVRSSPAAASVVVTTTAMSLTDQQQQQQQQQHNQNHIYTDQDVIMGRGGKSNNHKGNQLYLRDKDELQPRYFSVNKKAKTAIAQELVDRVHARGGRFMKEWTEDDDQDNETGGQYGGWIEVNNDMARRKASQSLRELSSKESRAKKRERYSKKHQKQHPQPTAPPPRPKNGGFKRDEDDDDDEN